MTSLMADPLDFAQRHRLTIGLALLVLVLVVAAYAAWPRQAATPTTTAAAAASSWTRICVAGVSYLQFTSGTSVEWTPGGKVKTCSEPAK